MPCCFHEPYDGECTGTEQRSEISVAGFGNVTEPFATAARILLWNKPDPGFEIPPAAEDFRIGDAGDKRGCERRSNARNGVEPLAKLI